MVGAQDGDLRGGPNFIIFDHARVFSKDTCDEPEIVCQVQCWDNPNLGSQEALGTYTVVRVGWGGAQRSHG